MKICEDWKRENMKEGYNEISEEENAKRKATTKENKPEKLEMKEENEQVIATDWRKLLWNVKDKDRPSAIQRKERGRMKAKWNRGREYKAKWRRGEEMTENEEMEKKKERKEEEERPLCLTEWNVPHLNRGKRRNHEESGRSGNAGQRRRKKRRRKAASMNENGTARQWSIIGRGK